MGRTVGTGQGVDYGAYGSDGSRGVDSGLYGSDGSRRLSIGWTVI